MTTPNDAMKHPGSFKLGPVRVEGYQGCTKSWELLVHGEEANHLKDGSLVYHLHYIARAKPDNRDRPHPVNLYVNDTPIGSLRTNSPTNITGSVREGRNAIIVHILDDLGIPDTVAVEVIWPVRLRPSRTVRQNARAQVTRGSNRPWSPEEDEHLRKVIAEQLGAKSRWGNILTKHSSVYPGRSIPAIRSRYYKKLKRD